MQQMAERANTRESAFRPGAGLPGDEGANATTETTDSATTETTESV